MGFATDGRVGCNMTATDGLTPRFAVGTQMVGDKGSLWMYVKASGAITIYDCVWINASLAAASITPALAITAGQVGFAQFAFADLEYGWVMLRGKPVVRLTTACAVDVPLYTSNTAGMLSNTTLSLSHYQVEGVVAETSISASLSFATVQATFPQIRRPIGTA